MIQRFLKVEIAKNIRFLFSKTKPASGKSVFYQKNRLPEKPKISKAIKNETKSLLNSIEKAVGKTSEIENMSAQDVYKKMDSTLEGFFYKRDYNIKNFNFLLQILSEKKQYEESLKIFDKMEELNIKPNVVSYTHLIKTCAKTRKIQEAEHFFNKALAKFGDDKYLYTSLMNCYARAGESFQALKLFQLMKEKGLLPDVASYTTLINSFYKSKNIQKCWELFDEVRMGGSMPPDEHLVGLMIEICAHTHDAEKAKALFRDIKDNFKEIAISYNGLIKALGSRTDYAKEAIEIFYKMTDEAVSPDQDTYLCVLKACSNLGDVKTAYDVIKLMQNDGFEINKYVYNEMLRTYAGALSHDLVPDNVKDTYIMDSWKLLEQIKKEKKVSIQILNSLLLVHCKAMRMDHVEGLVLPLYEQFNIAKNEFTYEPIIDYYTASREIQKVFNIYDHMKNENIAATYKSLNNYLEIAMRTETIPRIVEALKEFKKRKLEPKVIYLKRLGESENLPPEIYIELTEFDKKFGFVADKVYRVKKPNKYLSM